MSLYLQTLRLFTRDLRLLLAAVTFHGISFFGITTLLLNLYLLRLGYGLEFIGLVNGVAPTGFAALSLQAGAFGRRWGYRRAVIAGMSVILLGTVLLPFNEFVPAGWQATWLVSTNALAWLGGALYVVNSTPFLMRLTTSAERDHAFSIQSALLPLAGFGGNIIGGLLPDFFASGLGLSFNQPAPYRYTLWLAAALIVPALLALLLIRETGYEPHESETSGTGSVPFGPVILLAVVILFRTSGEWVVRIFFNAYLDTELQVATATIGLLSAAGQLLGGVALLSPLIVARWGKERVTGWGITGVAGSTMLLALFTHWLGAGLGFMGVIAMTSLIAPAYLVLSQEVVAPGWRSLMSGATTMAIGLGIAGMSVGGGYVAAAVGYRNLFLIGAGLSAVAAVLFFLYFRVPRGEYARSAAGTETLPG